MASDGSVVIVIDGDDSKFKSALGKLGGVASSALGGVTKAIGAVSAGLAAAAGAAIKVGSDFEQVMANTSTMFGDVAVDTEGLNAKILELSSSTGVAASQIGSSLYNALSAGIPATEDMGDAMEYMESCTMLAKAGFTDIDTAVTATAKILNAYGMDVSETADVHKILMQTQNKGITTVGELGASLAQVTPTAAAMKVGFDQVGASLASMTAQGTPTAQATTQLNSLLAELGKSGTMAQKGLEASLEGTQYAGKSFQELMAEGVPLNAVLDLMGDYATANGKSMLDMFSSIEGGKAALALSGENSAKFAENLAAMATEADVVGSAYEKVTDTLQAKTEILKENVANLGISIYDSLQEPLKETASTAISMLSELQNAFNEGGMAGMVRAAGDVMARLVTEIAGAAPKIIDTAVSLIQAFLTGIQNNLPALAQGAVGIIVSLNQGIVALLPQLAEVAVQLITALVDGFASALPQLLPAAAQAVAQLAIGLASHAGELVSAALNLIRSLALGLIAALPVLVDAIPEVIAGLVTGIIENLPQIIAVGLEIIVALAVGIIQAIPKLIMAIPKIIAAVVDGFTSHDWAGTGRQSMEALAQGIAGGTGAVKSAGKGVLNAATSSVSSLPSALQTTGRNSVTSLANGIQQGRDNAKNAARSIAEGVEGEIQKTSAKASSIGKHISEGVASGIRNGKSQAVNAMANMAASILAKARSALGIHSPSRVMREQVGRFIPQGLEAGITAELPQLERSVSAQLAGLTDRLRAAVEGETLRVSAQLAPAAASTPARTRADGSGGIFTVNVYPGGGMGVQQARDVGREIGAETHRELRRRGLTGI